jgi:hypothetical protein
MVHNHMTIKECPSFLPKEPVVPPAWQWISLSHALTWVAFKNSMDCHSLLNLLAMAGDHEAKASQELLADAVCRLADLARAGKIEVTGKYSEAPNIYEEAMERRVIPTRDFGDFRKLDLLHDGLRRGNGHAMRFGGEGFERAIMVGARNAYHSIEVFREALLTEFPPPPVVRLTHQEVVDWCKNWIAAGNGNGGDKAWPDFENHPRRMGLARESFRSAWNEAKGLKKK